MAQDYAPKPNFSASGTMLPSQRLTVGSSVISCSGFSSTTNLCVLEVQGGNIYATVDGTTPSATNGHVMYATNVYHWNVSTAQVAKFIQVSSSVTVQVSQFTATTADTQMPQTNVFLPAPYSIANQNLVTSTTVLTESAGAVTVNWTSGNNFRWTLNANCTVTFSNPVDGQTILIKVLQATSSSYTLTWPTIKWAAGSAPLMTTSMSVTDTYTVNYDGAVGSYFGAYVQNMK
jgi:hypothetical protein